MNYQNKKEEYQKKINEIEELSKKTTIKEALKSMNMSPGTYYAWKKFLGTVTPKRAQESHTPEHPKPLEERKPLFPPLSSLQPNSSQPYSSQANSSIEPMPTKASSKVIALIGDADQISSLLSKAIEVSRRAS